jgi:ABC transporter substrate binding protein
LIAILGDDASVWKPWTEAFVEQLRDLGWIESRNVGIEYRWSEGRVEPLAAIAAEFVQQRVDVIVTYGGAVKTLTQAAPSTPIVFAIAVDPVRIGLVPNLSHPGGTVTGMSVQSTDLAGKRLELLREVVPAMRRLAIMFDAGYPAAALGKPGGARRGAHPGPCGRIVQDTATRGHSTRLCRGQRGSGCTLRCGKLTRLSRQRTNQRACAQCAATDDV